MFCSKLIARRILISNSALAVVNTRSHGAAAAPVPKPSPSPHPQSQTSQALNGLDIRLLPLGDSITAGFQSTDNNGYRKVLHDALAKTNKVNFIGSQKTGDMPDNNNEGHNGFRIDQIAGVCNGSLEQQPSIVLLHAGTNDMREGGFEDQAPDHLGALIDQIFALAPETTLLVAQVIGSNNATQQSLIDTYNSQIPAVVQQRADAGKAVSTIDMSHVLDVQDDFTDQWHPNDGGYQKLGQAWFNAIGDVHQRGMIKNAS